MPKTVGIITEYNPFHKGHLYQIQQLKQRGFDNIAVAMSGSCVQRGEFAFMSKFDRAKCAVLNGVSLVCELPFPYSSFSAEGFAKSGIRVLKNLGVDAVSFGSESGDITLLKSIANFLLSEEYSEILKKYLSENIPFASAREKAVMEKIPFSAKIISSSNDILAVEYIKEALRLNWDVEFVPIVRKGANYNDFSPKEGFASARYIRSLAEKFDFEKAALFVPENIKDFFLKNLEQGEYFVSDISFEKAALHILKSMKAEDFLLLPDCNKELSHCFENAACQSVNFDSLFEYLPTKRYTRARLNRIILFAFMKYKSNADFPLPFIRVLAMDKNGETILKNAKSVSKLPISHSYRILRDIDENCRIITEYESRATDSRSLFSKFSNESRTDYTYKLFKMQ